MKIGYVSDLHLEGSNITPLQGEWDILVIAGDLSAELSMLDGFFRNLDPDIPVVYVLGNHEYEGQRLCQLPDKIREVTDGYPQVHLLIDQAVEIKGVRFLGSTLWSDFSSGGTQMQSKKWAVQNVVDFSYIFFRDEPTKPWRSLTGEKMIELHEYAVQWLTLMLRIPFPGPTVIVTHFAPHKKSIHEKFRHTDSSYWVNDLEHLMGRADLWIHGHVHTSFDYTVEGTRVVCNPRGYSPTYDLSGNTDYQGVKVLDMEWLAG